MKESTFAVQGPPFNLQLTHWDKRFVPMYSQRILCFALPEKTSAQNERLVHLLHTALQATLEEVPFLAGSVVPSSKELPWLHDIRATGAAYLDVRDYSQELSFQNLRQARFSSTLLDSEKLSPFPKTVYIQDDPVDVCRFRANFVEGGLLLVVSIAHTICDGHGISDILKIFADKLRRIQADEPPSRATGLQNGQLSYSFDRNSVLSGSGGPGAIENHSGWTTSPLKSNRAQASSATLCKTFYISKESLRALKEAAKPSPSVSTAVIDEVAYISTHDAIGALIWRSTMLARHRAGIISDNTITHMCQPVDCRTRLNLPEPYFGNAIYGTEASLSIAQMKSQSSGFQSAARAIRAEVNASTAEKFRDLLDFVKRTEMETHTRLSLMEDLTRGNILLTSYFGFGMHEIDFGEALGGKIEAFRLPSRGLVPGFPVILPRLPGGGCEFVMNEHADTMRSLLEDEDFGKYAGELC